MTTKQDVYNSVKTVTSMFIHQGYDPEYLEGASELTYDDFHASDSANQDEIFFHTRKGEMLGIAFFTKNSLSDKLYAFMKNAIDEIIKTENDPIKNFHIILVIKSIPKVTRHEITQRIKALFKGKYPIDLQIFSFAETSIDIMKSNYTPETIHILTKEEEKQFMDMYKLTPAKMPHISATDPMVRYFNAKIGNIIRAGIIVEESGVPYEFRYVS